MYETPCRADPELWFPVDERPDSPGVAQAVALCSGCAVRDACLAWALDNPEHSAAGVWGGFTTAQRDALLRNRPRWVVVPDQPPVVSAGPSGRPRARCGECGNRQHVRANGTLGTHLRVTERGRASHCSGSGSEPGAQVDTDAHA